MDNLIIDLFDIGCVKFGEFTLKSGLKSPIYFDLRLLVSYPKTLKTACEIFAKEVKQRSLEFEIICGVPYGAISLATGISFETGIPMIFKRKDAKAHGTKKMVEGIYQENDRCLVVDDVVTSGISILETVESLRSHKICVKDAMVLLDREQGGSENVGNSKVILHSIIKTSQILDVLFSNKKIDQSTFDKTHKFLEANKYVPVTKSIEQPKTKEMSFEERSVLSNNKIAKKLFGIMATKQSNLCVSADFNSFNQLLKTADELGPHICMLKTHIDIVNDFSMDNMQQLVDLSLKHNFLIFEDRKFADIGNTVKHQYNQGIYKISQWADIINAHSLSGDGCIKGLKDACDLEKRGCLLIAQLSCKGNLINDAYTKETVKMAEENSDFVFGFISQKNVSTNPAFIHMAPGIQFNESKMGDSLGQQYTTPEMSIIDHKCDLIIVGRGIIKSEAPIETAIRYKKSAFDAYLKRIHQSEQ